MALFATFNTPLLLKGSFKWLDRLEAKEKQDAA
jgi:hypothetical protein